METDNRTTILKAYYARYLTEVRNLSKSSVNHYFDALNNISRRLKAKGLVKDNIYEIRSLDTLKMVMEILFSDDDFIEMNRRGNYMYKSGLNNYYRFAQGNDFYADSFKIDRMDMVLQKEQPVLIEQTIWRRSDILRAHVLKAANYTCEMDSKHESFIADSTNKPYMEGHHAIPMSLQNEFDNSLDVYANIVCLCPICHRKIHYGLKNERCYMLKKLYNKRAERLEKSGIILTEPEFVEIAL